MAFDNVTHPTEDYPLLWKMGEGPEAGTGFIVGEAHHAEARKILIEIWQARLDAGRFREVGLELQQALGKFPPINSPHEGWAIIFEELDELWQHVRDNSGRSPQARTEAIQIAAMALRYIHDLIDIPG